MTAPVKTKARPKGQVGAPAIPEPIVAAAHATEAARTAFAKAKAAERAAVAAQTTARVNDDRAWRVAAREGKPRPPVTEPAAKTERDWCRVKREEADAAVQRAERALNTAIRANLQDYGTYARHQLAIAHQRAAEAVADLEATQADLSSFVALFWSCLVDPVQVEQNRPFTVSPSPVVTPEQMSAVHDSLDASAPDRLEQRCDAYLNQTAKPSNDSGHAALWQEFGRRWNEYDRRPDHQYEVEQLQANPEATLAVQGDGGR